MSDLMSIATVLFEIRNAVIRKFIFTASKPQILIWQNYINPNCTGPDMCQVTEYSRSPDSTCNDLISYSSQAVSKTLWHIPLLYVQWKGPDDGHRNCPKHVQFYSKYKIEKLMHLVGFIIRIYHGTRSPERQKCSVDKKNQLDVTFCILYFSSNSCSTCFGQPCAHHQELTTAWCYSLVLVCAVAAGRWSSLVGR